MQTLDIQEAVVRLANSMSTDRRLGYCHESGRNEIHQSQSTCTGAPDILFVKRGRHLDGEANMSTNVRIPLTLDLSQISGFENTNYRLIATIHRESLQPNSYYAIFFDHQTGQWIQYRNGVMIPIQVGNNALSSTAFFFLYNKV